MKKTICLIFALLSSVLVVDGGVVAVVAGYGACQTACNAGYVACLAAAGSGTWFLTIVTSGLYAIFGTPAAIAACSAVQAACMASCATAFLAAPTP
uniref:Uncharacterized protein n=1 Tax=Strigamia maritima TaxID=126957 RepID=T1J1C0_STRMM